MTTDLRDPIDDQQLERRLRATFGAVMPLLDAAVVEPSAALVDAAATEIVIDTATASPSPPQRNHGRVAAAMLAAAAAVALTVVVTQRDPAATPLTDTVPGAAETAEPAWYRVIRPVLPDGFDQIALTYVGPEALNLKAWNTGSGQILDVSIGLRAGDLKQTTDTVTATDPYGTWFESTSGVALETIDGRMISLSCGVIAVAGGAVGSVAMTGSTRDYCNGEFPHPGIDPAGRRALVERLATDFPVEAVDQQFGLDTLSNVAADMDRAAATVERVVPEIDMTMAGTVWDKAILFTDLSTSAEGVGSTMLSVVHGVYPVRVDTASPSASAAEADPIAHMFRYDDVAVGWMVNDRGIGFQIATRDTSEQNLRRLGGLLEQMALAPTRDVPLSSVPGIVSTTTTSLLAPADPDMPAAYDEVMAGLPGNGWTALVVTPAAVGNLSVYEPSGGRLSFAYLDSTIAYRDEPGSTLPPVTADGGAPIAYPQSNGSLIFPSTDGDGVAVGCADIAGTLVPCSQLDNLAELSAVDLEAVSRGLLPLLRQGQSGPLGSLIGAQSVEVDYQAAEDWLHQELGTPAVEIFTEAGMLTTLDPGEPVTFQQPDGSTVVSMVTAEGVMFRVRTGAGVLARDLAPAVSLMTQFVRLNVTGAPVTTLPPA